MKLTTNYQELRAPLPEKAIVNSSCGENIHNNPVNRSGGEKYTISGENIHNRNQVTIFCFFFHLSTHPFAISLNFKRSSHVQGCATSHTLQQKLFQ